jgi:hypothetical protein
MEDYGWLIFIAAVWIFSTIGEMRKAQRKRQRQERQMPDRDGDEARQVGPAALQRDLENDLGDAARRAEEALRRWEARQAPAEARVESPRPAPEPAVRRRKGPGQRARERARARAAERHRHEASRELDFRGGEAGSRREAAEERRGAYEAIAGMLGGTPARAPAETRAVMPLRKSPIAGREMEFSTRRSDLAPPVRGNRPGASGFERIEQLPMLQRAMVLREVLGPPKALSPESDLY